jgi:formate-dependent nitrite reductase cytochrome c552 subunit
MMQGFFRWASKAFSGDFLESALVLQRGYFVAQVRRSDYLNAGGRPATADNMPEGACYTYNSPVVHSAIHTDGMARDFTGTAEQLLEFV